MGLQTWQFSQHGGWKPKDYDQWASTPDIPFPVQYLFQKMPPWHGAMILRSRC